MCLDTIVDLWAPEESTVAAVRCSDRCESGERERVLGRRAGEGFIQLCNKALRKVRGGETQVCQLVEERTFSAGVLLLGDKQDTSML